MTYKISKQIEILHEEDDWCFTFSSDEYGKVEVCCTEGLEAMTGKTRTIYIPKDCIQNFINALEQFKDAPFSIYD